MRTNRQAAFYASGMRGASSYSSSPSHRLLRKSRRSAGAELGGILFQHHRPAGSIPCQLCCKQCAGKKLRFLIGGQGMRKEQGFRIIFDGMAAMRTFDDAEFIGSNAARSELIDLKRFAASGTLTLHVSHGMLTFKNRKPKIRKSMSSRLARTAMNIKFARQQLLPVLPR
jgi:hypothetical protein